MWVYVIDSDLTAYLIARRLEPSPETFQLFLKDVGTTDVKWNKPIRPSYHPVPPGSCIRLRTPEDYVSLIRRSLTREKEDKSRRSSSCSIV